MQGEFISFVALLFAAHWSNLLTAGTLPIFLLLYCSPSTPLTLIPHQSHVGTFFFLLSLTGLRDRRAPREHSKGY